MTINLKTIPFLITFILAIPFSAFADQFKTTRVCDEDTVKAHDSEVEINVRLMGIDAPETSKKQKRARSAIKSTGQKIPCEPGIEQDR